MPDHPLAEVFGFPIDNFSQTARRFRQNRLCPYFNRVPNCTKDKANDPIGVCSVFSGEETVITCPIRFQQDWLIVEDTAAFLFPPGTKWTSLTQVPLPDQEGGSAGNIDVVLVSYDDQGAVTDFGSLEIQAVYISGNIRRPFEYYMEDPEGRVNMIWKGKGKYARPDFLSSSRKRLVPQLLYKGTILHDWGKKQVVVVDKAFFSTLPDLPQVESAEADIAWLIYELVLDPEANIRRLVKHSAVYTPFLPALTEITTPKVGPMSEFVENLQERLDTKLNGDENPPDTASPLDLLAE